MWHGACSMWYERLCPYNVMLCFVCGQVVEDGYEFFARRQLVTLFSAPNYCGDYDNAGGMMSVDEQLFCSFQVSSFLHPILASPLSPNTFPSPHCAALPCLSLHEQLMLFHSSDLKAFRKEGQVSILGIEFWSTHYSRKNPHKQDIEHTAPSFFRNTFLYGLWIYYII